MTDGVNILYTQTMTNDTTLKCGHCGEPIEDRHENDGNGRPQFQHIAAADGLPYNYCTSPGTAENPGIKYHLADIDWDAWRAECDARVENRYGSDIEELRDHGELGGPRDEVQYAEESEDEWL